MSDVLYEYVPMDRLIGALKIAAGIDDIRADEWIITRPNAEDVHALATEYHVRVTIRMVSTAMSYTIHVDNVLVYSNLRAEWLFLTSQYDVNTLVLRLESLLAPAMQQYRERVKTAIHKLDGDDLNALRQH